MENEKWLSIAEAAALLKPKVSPPTIYTMIENGLINRTNKIAGRRTRIEVRLSDVIEFRNLGVRDA
ncbi:helix-turn-helix domain-containing protein [Candidatus Pacearchaeota archaeon]|nr:helix-turn-helix domain-containing protein [Candidatus Pacearchaeota archaeon]